MKRIKQMLLNFRTSQAFKRIQNECIAHLTSYRNYPVRYVQPIQQATNQHELCEALHHYGYDYREAYVLLNKLNHQHRRGMW